MFKKTLLSLAVASSLGLTGCLSSGDEGANANPDYKISNPDFTGKTWPLFNPLINELPVPSDLQFAQGAGADGTLNGSTDNPITNALDYMDGSSTTAQFDIKLSASIDPTSINATPVVMIGGAPAPNPNQNVFLLALDFPGSDSLLNNGSFYTKLIADLVADGDIAPAPTRTSFPGETPTFKIGLAFKALQDAATNFGPTSIEAAAAASNLLSFNNEYRAEVVSLDGGDNNVLRITPLRPLNPKTKYLVVVTNGVTDNAGDAIVASPSYQNISDPEQPLGNPALAAVRGAISGWEKLATGYFTNLTNTARPSSSLTNDDIALSLTFTTGGTTDVLEAAASPAQFFYKSAIVSTRQEAIAKYLAQNADTFEGLDPSQQYGALALAAGAAVATVGDANLRGFADTTETNLGLAGADFSNPKPRPITPVEATRIPASLAIGATAKPGSIFQGGIQLPYYLGIPTDSDPSALNTTWKASTTVGGIIDAGAGADPGTTPPSDKVTFRYPFAEEQGSVFAPLMISVPDDTACNAEKPYSVVIYQHGIFGNRSHSLALGNQLAGSCFVTVAMDLPLHGIAPKLATGTADPSLAFSVDVTESGGVFSPSLLPMNERHFGWGQTAQGSPARMVYSTTLADAIGSSAQYFLNLANLPAARDNNRQAVVDLLNLNASLVGLNGLDLDNADSDSNPATGAGDVNVGGTSNVYFVGHSLGGIVGTAFVALANDAAQDATIGNTSIVPITAAALVTPGAGIAKLLENSPSIGATVLAGLANSGLTQGTSNLELFLNVAQASLDSAEPHNFVSSLLDSNSKVYVNEIYGDGMTKTTQDQTIPIAADTAYAGLYSAPLGNALPAPLAGTEPLIAQLESDTITADGATASNTNVVRFTAGTHSTIIQPSTAAETAVFADMATNIISFFSLDGNGISFNNGAYVKQSAPSPSNP